MRTLDIAKTVAEATGLPLSESLRLVELVLQLVCDTLGRGEPVKIAGFGKFSIRQKQARPGRNPRTGETIPINARRVAQFRARHRFKEAVAKAGHRHPPHEPKPAVQSGEMHRHPCL